MKWVGIAVLIVVVVVVALAGISRLTAAELKPGDAAPDFKLTGSDGKTYKLSDFRGKQAVVLAWFPKAFTSGCTAQCKSLQAGGEKLRHFDIAYFAASVDPVEKNTKFAESLSADYPILSDPTGATARAYGVTDAIRPFANRWTFYMDKDGKILYIDKNVNPARHADDVAKKLAELKIPEKPADAKAADEKKADGETAETQPPSAKPSEGQPAAK